jgi:pimeloyl-ACP methyl ester carboxylesterase
MTEHFTITSGLARLAGESAGSGPAVVFLHAGVTDRRMWRAEMDALKRDHQVIAYDRRGFGETIAPEGSFSHVDDLAAVLDHLGCRTATLVGCSQGGRIAIDFALSRPDRVAALVLVAPAVTGAVSPAEYPAEIARRIEELEQAEEDDDLEHINAMEAWFWLDGPTSPEGRVGGTLRELFLDMNSVTLNHAPIGDERPAPNAMSRLQQIKVPTLVVWGDLDFEHIQKRSAQIAATIPGAEAFPMPGTAHLPNLEQPKPFITRLRAFLGAAKR